MKCARSIAGECLANRARAGSLASRYAFRNNSGSLAIFNAIRRASTFVSSFSADRPSRLILEINIRECLPDVVADDETRRRFARAGSGEVKPTIVNVSLFV
jgi:hypothetical protein